MVTDGEATGCSSAMAPLAALDALAALAVLTAQYGVAVNSGLFCSGGSLQFSSLSSHCIRKRILSDRRPRRLICVESCLWAHCPLGTWAVATISKIFMSC